MRYHLAAMVKRASKSRKKVVVFRPIVLPSTLASNLYADAYGPVLSYWTEAIPNIISEYERSLNELTTDGAPELSSVIVSVEVGISRLMVTLRLRLERWAAMVEAAHRRKWAGAVKASTGLDISALIGPRDMRQPIAMTIERNVGLIKSVSDQARQRIGEAVFSGLNKRASARDVAADIRTAVAMGRRRSLNIASHQMTNLADQLAQERRREAGLDTFEWIHSGKVHARPEHVARNGKRYTDDDPPPDMPGELPGCGCTSRAVLSLDSEF